MLNETKRKGFYARPEIREKRFSPIPISKETIMKIVDAIMKEEHISKDLPKVLKEFLKKRDACLIAILWLFGKRISEVLALRVNDIWIEGDELKAKFFIKKKAKVLLICPKCKQRNGRMAKFCKSCGESLENAEKKIFKPQEIAIVKKKKITSSDAVAYVIDYLEFLKKYGVSKETPLFPSVLIRQEGKEIGIKILRKTMTRQRAFQLLATFGLCPHLFRSAMAKRLLRESRGNIMLVKRFGDWSKVDMVLEYAKSIGETHEDEEVSKLE